MCNAWNHHIDCKCGWGGEGHLGGGNGNASREISSSSLFNWKQCYESYLNPNAICPVCGAPVFFYQSPHGGRVFFDSVGPPWPKHPCTDNPAKTIEFIESKPIIPKWVNWGLSPAIFVKLSDTGKRIIGFIILNKGKGNVIEVYNYSERALTLIRSADFIFIKKIDETHIEVKCYFVTKEREETFNFKRRKIERNIIFQS